MHLKISNLKLVWWEYSCEKHQNFKTWFCREGMFKRIFFCWLNNVCLKELKVKTSLLGMIYGLILNKKATKLKTVKTS